MTEPFSQEHAALAKRGKFKEAIKTAGSPGEWFAAFDKKWGAMDYKLRARGMAEILTDPKSVDILKRASSLPTDRQAFVRLAARVLLLTMPQSQLR